MGSGLVWARRDGAGVPVAAVVPGVAVVPSPVSVLTALAPVNVAVLSFTVSAAAFVLVPSSVLPVSPFVASACACCSAVA